MMGPFTDPFRYSPHPLVRKAARQVIERLDRMISEGLVPEEVAKGFADGKMLGVLICHPKGTGDTPVTLAAFSGSVGGQCIIEGFVPPIFDLTEDGGFYRTHEADISEINMQISGLTESELVPARERMLQAEKERDSELCCLRALRHDSIAESQFRNAEIKRAKDRWKARLTLLTDEMHEIQDRIDTLKKLRARMSDDLQKWIFSRYIVRNAEGGTASVLEIFEKKGMMPPGGTGDCAAPKLLNHAFNNGLRPVAMGEFWYGRSPATAVRTHGHFYPSCTSKCGPLLEFMMLGLRGRMLNGPRHASEHIPSCSTSDSEEPDVIYEDEWIVVVEKPSGMPSVPGLDGQTSLLERLNARGSAAGTVHEAVHRLDMDTSGIMLFAKSP